MSLYETITIGGNDYDSFESVSDADIYLAVDPTASAWRALPDADAKGGYLVAATRVFVRQSWQDGVIADPLPQAIKDATALLAAAMAGGYDAANQATTASGVRRQKAGSVEQEFFWSQTIGAGLRFPLPIWELIKGFLDGADSSGIGATASTGTCGRSIADIDYGYGPQFGDDYDDSRRRYD